MITGAAGALLLWLALAVLARGVTRVDTANRDMYDQLRERLAGLEQRLAMPPPEPYDHVAYQEACTHRDFIKKTLEEPAPGLSWVTATGYNNLWSRVHRAEEALLQFAPAEVVIGQAIYDEGRLTGAPIDDWKRLMEQLSGARKDLEAVLRGATAERHHEPEAEHGEAAWNPRLVSEPAARAQLRAISYLINRFRGERWEALARARVQLDDTAVLTGVVAYAILVIVLMTGVAKEQITAATIFFLVGAVVGLFNRLLGDLDSDRVIEDYGLHKARLLHTPLYSGLAALGGVLVIAMLPDLGGTALNLAAAFDLAKNPFGLVVAAVFGLTPRLLIDRLQSQVERYKGELKKTAASEGENNG